MPHSNSELTTKNVLKEVGNLIQEGYILINEVNWMHFIHRYMTHKSNGNRIDIFGYPESGDIIIHKNRKRIKQYNVLCK